MSVYVHHVPGRLRVRTRWVARCPHRARQLSELVTALPGVHRVEVNPRADSVIVHYDPLRLTPETVLGRLGAAGMIDPAPPGSAAPVGGPRAAAASNGIQLQVAAGAAALGAMFGKALFDAVLHKGVEHSIRTLVGGRRR